MADRLIPARPTRGLSGPIIIGVVLLVLLIGGRYIASTLIDYAWWQELGQLDTWVNLLLYGTVPVILAAIVLFAAFSIAFRLGVHNAPGGFALPFLREATVFKIALLVLAVVAVIVANATVDNWTVVRFFGGLKLPPSQTSFVDPLFGNRLGFYFFGLPFYNLLLHVILTGAVLSILIYWGASRLKDLGSQFPLSRAGRFEFAGDLTSIRSLDSPFVRLAVAILLAGFGVKFFFNRYDLLFQDHGVYLVGADWVATHLVLPLQWLMIAGAFAAALLVLAKRARWALPLLLIVPVRFVLPSIVTGVYVRPNELNLERPYIQYHIDATRSAYGLNQRVTEAPLDAELEIPIDYGKHKPLLDNVRLWDWRAFRDTITQIQPLRPYTYIDSDVDRYQIGGQLRQVLISPRELEISQLQEAKTNWINPHFVYTHGYGIVMAEANRITSDGLPVLFVKDAPPVVTSKDLKLVRPEIYYGEVAHEPVFVDTTQAEFNYPSGTKNIPTRYTGNGGISVSSPLMRLAAAVHYGDLNILLTGNLTSQSRMMIRRAVQERLTLLAGFITWDADPYMVLTDDGHLVWMADGYMVSDAHPYSRTISLGGGPDVNYIRNSVKATIDAYTGETNMYVFDPADVLIQAYSRLFPHLFKPESAMPADLRAHARYPETLFIVQAEIYRNFHMRDAEAFYNRGDLWDIAKTSSKQGDSSPSFLTPTYVVATLPGDNKPEFMLLMPFTPANKSNLIGVMLARCDGPHLGELVFQQLSKQNIIYGPLNIEARINQDQTISKDLTLWNQQGSQVLRGQTLVLPIENSFLYVVPIYIQASQASMPQLKKVALAMGNKLAYADTYEQALTQLIGELGGTEQQAQPQPVSTGQSTSSTQPQQPAEPTGTAVQTLGQVRDHLRRYRDLNAQGKWAEAGQELEQIQRLVQK